MNVDMNWKLHILSQDTYNLTCMTAAAALSPPPPFAGAAQLPVNCILTPVLCDLKAQDDDKDQATTNVIVCLDQSKR